MYSNSQWLSQTSSSNQEMIINGFYSPLPLVPTIPVPMPFHQHENILFNSNTLASFCSTTNTHEFYASAIAHNADLAAFAAAESKAVAAPPQNARKITRYRRQRTDRHSKICTSQGMRDRRMRLSLNVAREFFSLQDMLGFDKASHTVDWLLKQSKSAIDELGKKISSSSSSVASDYETMMNCENKSMNASMASSRESREKARERARERTREKRRIEGEQTVSEGRKNNNQVSGAEDFGAWFDALAYDCNTPVSMMSSLLMRDDKDGATNDFI